MKRKRRAGEGTEEGSDPRHLLNHTLITGHYNKKVKMAKTKAYIRGITSRATKLLVYGRL